MMIAHENASQPMTSWATPWKRPGRSRSALTSTATIRTGKVARSSNGPTTSPPGKLHPHMPNRSGTTASHATTAPTASHPGSGSSSYRALARHSTTSRTVAAVADATSSHVDDVDDVQTRTTGRRRLRRWRATAISAAVDHHTPRSAAAGPWRRAPTARARRARLRPPGGPSAAAPARSSQPPGAVDGRCVAASLLRHGDDDEGKRRRSRGTPASRRCP